MTAYQEDFIKAFRHRLHERLPILEVIYMAGAMISRDVLIILQMGVIIEALHAKKS